MNGNKLFAASIAILALALGFFLGNLHIGGCCCQKANMACCKKMEGHHGPHGDFNKGPSHKGFKGPNFEVIDSLLQVTPEQKAALEASRAKGDSIFKDLRAQKHDAEKALGAALESGDQKAIDVAKAQVLDADKALLEHRINGVAGLAKILSKEQLDKFNQFHKEQMKKFKDRMKEGHHGPKGPKGPHEGHHEGPHGELPPPPPQQ